MTIAVTGKFRHLHNGADPERQRVHMQRHDATLTEAIDKLCNSITSLAASQALRQVPPTGADGQAIKKGLAGLKRACDQLSALMPNLNQSLAGADGAADPAWPIAEQLSVVVCHGEAMSELKTVRKSAQLREELNRFKNETSEAIKVLCDTIEIARLPLKERIAFPTIARAHACGRCG